MNKLKNKERLFSISMLLLGMFLFGIFHPDINYITFWKFIFNLIEFIISVSLIAFGLFKLIK
jgi:hypothetical protein